MKCAACGHFPDEHGGMFPYDGTCQKCECKKFKVHVPGTPVDTRSPEWWQQFYRPPEPGPSETM